MLYETLQSSIISGWDVDRMMRLYDGRNNERFKEFIRELADEVRMSKEQQTVSQQSEVAAYIAEHILDPELSPAAVGEAFGIPESAVASLLRESTGVTFAKYVTHCRMEYVRAELVRTDRQIKDIVADVGYGDVSNFTRKFRLQYGCTPSAYRERERSEI